MDLDRIDDHNEKILEITPSRHLLPYLGHQDYFFPDALAEFVDNSFDSFHRFEQGEHEQLGALIKISFKINGNKIVIEDNAGGMSLSELEQALRLASVKNDEERNQGFFGVGMKSACTSLGKRFMIRTTKKGENAIYCINYDEDRWLNYEKKDDEIKWSIDYTTEPKTNADLHFTIIEISELKVKLHSYRKDQILDSFGRRYGPFIRKGEIKILINNDICKAEEEYELLEDKKLLGTDGVIGLSSGQKIHGWIGLLKKSSQKGLYGIHLFRHNRLISAFDKELLRPKTIKWEIVESSGHPSLARIIGELHIDHVPVNINKRKFLFESEAWEEVKKAVCNDPVFLYIIKEARKLAQEKRKKEIPLSTRTKLDSILSDLSKSEANNTGNSSIKESSEHLLERHLIYSFENSGVDSPPYKYSTDEQNFKIVINQDFPAFDIAKDKFFYSVFWLVDAMASDKSKGSHAMFFAERETLLRRILELVNKIKKD